MVRINASFSTAEMRPPNARVSIALPVYNGEDYLREALESFRTQTYPYFDLTICDNASTDRTPYISREYAAADPRFSYERLETFVNARDNFIRAYRLSIAGNPYFLWACDDNIWEPDFLLKTVQYMEQHPECSVCGCCFYEFDDKGVRRTVRNGTPFIFKWSRTLNILAERSSCVSLYALMRRDAIDRINLELRNIDDYPDRYYLMQLRGYGNFHVVPEVLLGYRGGGISSTKDDAWVKKVVDLKFGEAELSTLQTFRSYSAVERVLIANKFVYQSLRHNIPGTAFRWWLTPAYCVAHLMNRVRPSIWHVGPTGLEKREP